ncbi:MULTISPECIES: Holliday junction branch migration protein RuvA [unclassified Lactobacillus]|uniref:Holliday junction branch migration protein RuvA n=1 Tax=unclassified Lactobacillus TaxID=2620435 RepID=UPI000EFBE366|nr:MULTISPECIES: Holliday junction branch migration protein RuvA [unclassified Lactobacillus]RMC23929.1 Holliday junction branch migration protein RuvA [Lactobacillus sp. ESL0247]RMC28300.1 Holliday junction branch migration protein RuvA [Lactobacillus sp. ESL0246]RMC31026.1 Holliday junction branch migration protein RuvA [Lactobacillus sp. ESL0245]RMC47788.1 Holliday junction branch migration protein RuvA [Lactobacillus sp. ESL0228]
MYEYLIGIITVTKPNYLVIEVNGIGYKVYSPTPLEYQEGQKAKIFIEQSVRDTAITLYGFRTEEDKGLFLKLLSVSGIGPKSALAIMAAEDSNSLAEAIEQGEVKYLTRFPGVGKKTASQIVLDLKGKLGDYVQQVNKPIGQNVSPELNDALLALLALGYTKKEVDRIAPKLDDLAETTADQYIKKGLALLLKR